MLLLTFNAREAVDIESIEAYSQYSIALRLLLWLNFGVIFFTCGRRRLADAGPLATTGYSLRNVAGYGIRRSDLLCSCTVSLSYRGVHLVICGGGNIVHSEDPHTFGYTVVDDANHRSQYRIFLELAGQSFGRRNFSEYRSRAHQDE